MEREFSFWSVVLPAGITERTKDILLAAGIAFFGCVGSYFILGGSLKTWVKSSMRPESISHVNFQSEENLHGLDDKIKKNIPHHTGGSLLHVHGTLKVNEVITFQNLHFNGESQYLIDFGNGIRRIFHDSHSEMKYSDPGIYIAQTYSLEQNKWKLIAAQTLTIRP